MINRGEEDYIKGIYELERRQLNNELITNQQLMEYFSHTAQTVNEMVKKLVKKNLVEYKPYKGSALTSKGLQEAIKLVRIHRVWETFLVDKLGYTWDEVHEEAEGLEHVTSQRMVDRLFVYLGEPTICPHGNFIPDKDGVLQEREEILLINTEENKTYRLRSVLDNPTLLAYLDPLGLRIGTQFEVIKIDPVSEIITLDLRGNPVVLGFKVASALYVNNY